MIADRLDVQAIVAVLPSRVRMRTSPENVADVLDVLTAFRSHGGGSSFESWYADHCPPLADLDKRKQFARDAYAAGARDPASLGAAIDNASRAELMRLRGLINSPELHDFARGVTLEAAHQRERWGTDHDAGKAPADWFWTLGYLATKALTSHQAGNTDKALHHTITAAALLANWHAAIAGTDTRMRPGIDPHTALTASTTTEGDG